MAGAGAGAVAGGLSFKEVVSASGGICRWPWASPGGERSGWKWSVVRMGGGKRTFPGGVTKWQWKRLQAHKQRMREKAWLTRERRIYEKRKREELMAATTLLEKPWELQRFPARPVTADTQLSALADRFRKPGAFDLWNPQDGPMQQQREQGEGFEDAFGVEEEDTGRPLLPSSISGRRPRRRRDGQEQQPQPEEQRVSHPEFPVFRSAALPVLPQMRDRRGRSTNRSSKRLGDAE